MTFRSFGCMDDERAAVVCVQLRFSTNFGASRRKIAEAHGWRTVKTRMVVLPLTQRNISRVAKFADVLGVDRGLDDGSLHARSER
jgi:hypothetical protein